MLFLIGMPGAGKTYWGKKIAESYQLPFIDIDEVIESEAGMPIAAIFEQHGEEHFREIEMKVLHNVIGTSSGLGIIACGGGTPAFYDNLERMKKAGCVVYLSASLATLRHRLEADRNVRPLIDSNMEDKLKDLLSKRAPIYGLADYVVDVETATVHTFAQILETCINRR
jgi:shikimate kinase